MSYKSDITGYKALIELRDKKLLRSKKSSVVLIIVCSILVMLTAIVRWVFSVWKELNIIGMSKFR